MNNIILNLSDKNKDGDDFPLLRAYYNRNIDIIERLMNYNHKYNIKIDINGKTHEGKKNTILLFSRNSILF